MKVNFKAMPVEVKFGEPEVMDVRHTVGNTINRSTSEIGLADLARQIYYDDDPVEIPEVYRPVIKPLSRMRIIYWVPGKRR